MRTFQLPGIPRPCSRICLGTGGLGSAIPRDAAFALLDAFAAAGGTFLDTAHIYAAWLPSGEGASERTIGAWLAARGMTERMVIGTKGGHPPLDSRVPARLRPEQIEQDLRESLERLALPSVDLYWLHRDDPDIPVTEVLGVLERHRQQGRIRAYGASNWSTARMSQAQAAARRAGQAGFVASQIGWSLAEPELTRVPPVGMRFMDAATLAWHRQSGLPQIPYSSQASGYFAKDEPVPMYDTPANARRKTAVRRLAQARGCSPNAVALAWLLAHPVGGSAIIGPRTTTQLADSLTAERLTLTPQECSALAA